MKTVTIIIATLMLLTACRKGGHIRIKLDAASKDAKTEAKDVAEESEGTDVEYDEQSDTPDGY